MAANITSIDALRELYGAPTAKSLKKQTCSLNDTYRQWLDQSCFFVIASAGVNGTDCAPRGDKAGQAFTIVDDKTILIPDRRGNNRLDTLSNIIHDPRIALLFLFQVLNKLYGCWVAPQCLMTTSCSIALHLKTAGQ